MALAFRNSPSRRAPDPSLQRVERIACYDSSVEKGILPVHQAQEGFQGNPRASFHRSLSNASRLWLHIRPPVARIFASRSTSSFVTPTESGLDSFATTARLPL